MTRAGLDAALSYGAKLPRFSTVAAAKRAMFEARDRALEHLRGLDLDGVLDGSPESLLALEAWYFALHARRGGFARIGTDRRRFETAMGLYSAAVAVRHAKAKWIVEEFGFAPGTYELGVTLGLTSLMGVDGMCLDWHRRTSNKYHRALQRDYFDHFPKPKQKKAAKKKRARR